MIYSSQQEAQAAIMPQEHTSELQPIQQTMYRAYEYIVEQKYYKNMIRNLHYKIMHIILKEIILCLLI